MIYHIRYTVGANIFVKDALLNNIIHLAASVSKHEENQLGMLI